MSLTLASLDKDFRVSLRFAESPEDVSGSMFVTARAPRRLLGALRGFLGVRKGKQEARGRPNSQIGVSTPNSSIQMVSCTRISCVHNIMNLE